MEARFKGTLIPSVLACIFVNWVRRQRRSEKRTNQGGWIWISTCQKNSVWCKKPPTSLPSTSWRPWRKSTDREEKYGREIWKKACEAGLVGAVIPEEYGGPGFGFLEQALITEQLSRVDLGLCLCVTGSVFGAEHIVFFGTEDQRKQYLPALVTGEAISAGAFTEPDAGTDVAGIRTRAVREGGDYVINGTKMFITNGTVCRFPVCLLCDQSRSG